MNLNCFVIHEGHEEPRREAKRIAPTCDYPFGSRMPLNFFVFFVPFVVEPRFKE
jgi:hypothetical protein